MNTRGILMKCCTVREGHKRPRGGPEGVQRGSRGGLPGHTPQANPVPTPSEAKRSQTLGVVCVVRSSAALTLGFVCVCGSVTAPL
eukprot:1064000-Prorocentrum_minimum.AAC.1